MLFRGGKYRLTEGLTIPKEINGDSSAAVVFKRYDNKKPTFTRCASLNRWQKLKNPAILKIIGKARNKKVYVVDLKKCGISDYGKMVGSENRAELYCNEELQTPARWPNGDFADTGKALGATTKEYGMHGTAEGIVEYLNPYIDRWASNKNVWLHCYPFYEWLDHYYHVTVDASDGVNPKSWSINNSIVDRIYFYIERDSF